MSAAGTSAAAGSRKFSAQAPPRPDGHGTPARALCELRTLEAVQRVEAGLGVPVAASSPADFWDVVGAGLDSRMPGRGRLLGV